MFEADVDALLNAAEKTIQENAEAMGADAIVGVDFDYQVIGDVRPMILLSVNGTAVKLD